MADTGKRLDMRHAYNRKYAETYRRNSRKWLACDLRYYVRKLTAQRGYTVTETGALVARPCKGRCRRMTENIIFKDIHAAITPDEINNIPEEMKRKRAGSAGDPTKYQCAYRRERRFIWRRCYEMEQLGNI